MILWVISSTVDGSTFELNKGEVHKKLTGSFPISDYFFFSCHERTGTGQ